VGFAAIPTTAAKGKEPGKVQEIGGEAATTGTGNGTSQPSHLLVAFQSSPGLQQTLLSSIQPMPQQKNAPKKSLWAPPSLLVIIFVKASGLLRHVPKSCTLGMAEGIVSHHGWWDAHQQPPAVADLPAAIHVGQDERKCFAARRENAWGGDGSSSPQPSGVRQHGVGNHGRDPAARQVPGELGDGG